MIGALAQGKDPSEIPKEIMINGQAYSMSIIPAPASNGIDAIVIGSQTLHPATASVIGGATVSLGLDGQLYLNGSSVGLPTPTGNGEITTPGRNAPAPTGTTTSTSRANRSSYDVRILIILVSMVSVFLIGW